MLMLVLGRRKKPVKVEEEALRGDKHGVEENRGRRV